MRKSISNHFILAACMAAMMVSLSACGTASKSAGTAGTSSDVKTYLTLAQMPDAGVYLPPPPAENSVDFLADSARYEWGKSLRGTARGEQAVQDAQWEIDYLLDIYAGPLGVKLTQAENPFLYNFLKKSLETINLGVTKAKAKYMRTRPYVHFGEPTPVPQDEEVLRTNGSYPSGHTVRGWGIALLLSELCPERQDAILQRGFAYGESRVIVGFHYQSDVNAARFAAAASLARMHADPLFMKDLNRAKKEFHRLVK